MIFVILILADDYIFILPTHFNCVKWCRHLPEELVLVNLKVFLLQIVGEHWIQKMISALLIYVIQQPTDVTAQIIEDNWLKILITKYNKAMSK